MGCQVGEGSGWGPGLDLVLALLLICCVTLGQLLSISRPQPLHLHNARETPECSQALCFLLSATPGPPVSPPSLLSTQCRGEGTRLDHQ